MPRLLSIVLVFWITCTCSLQASGQSAASEDEVFFESKVRPVRPACA